MPSYTFVATASAALNAGYVPHFVDVDPATFAMNPSALEGHPALASAGAVVAVAPYGRALDAAAWQRLSETTGVPVAIDAAARFDAFFSGAATVARGIPVVLSFHATKVFGVGEGGAILCSDAELWKTAGARSTSDSSAAAKPERDRTERSSEYHAAVGLAELDEWPAKRQHFLRVAQTYASAAQRFEVAGKIVVETAWASGYALYVAATGDDAARAAERLHAAGFGFRWWYGDGVHCEPGYASLPSDPLPVTGDLAPRLIGLPVWVDIEDAVIEGVVSAIAGR